MRVVAIIPARSGSQGLKNKNITNIAGRNLLERAVDFAKVLNLQDIFVTTDSEEYAEIAQEAGASILGLRSKKSSTSTAMEPEIIDDLNIKFDIFNVPVPNLAVWIRPTFPFRSLTATLECIDQVLYGEKTSARVVTEIDPRLYKQVLGHLKPIFHDGGASMIRRQGMNPLYQVFNIDVFKWTSSPCPADYLGDKIGFVVAPKICGVDIDSEEDLRIAEALLEKFGTGIIS